MSRHPQQMLPCFDWWQSAYQQGWAAAAGGGRIEDNPYSEARPNLRWEWEKGFEARKAKGAIRGYVGRRRRRAGERCPA